MDLGTDHTAADHIGLAEAAETHTGLAEAAETHIGLAEAAETHIGLAEAAETHIGLAGIVANIAIVTAVVVSVVEKAPSVQDIAAVMAADIVAVEGTAADSMVQQEDFVSAQTAVDTFLEIDNN